jgi:transcriptional regulator GlxA family with amidase domain
LCDQPSCGSHNHDPERDLSASWLSDRLGISPKDLEAAFRQHRSLDCDLSILNYRLSRLFERITTQPQTALEQQVMTCGLGSSRPPISISRQFWYHPGGFSCG